MRLTHGQREQKSLGGNQAIDSAVPLYTGRPGTMTSTPISYRICEPPIRSETMYCSSIARSELGQSPGWRGRWLAASMVGMQ